MRSFFTRFLSLIVFGAAVASQSSMSQLQRNSSHTSTLPDSIEVCVYYNSGWNMASNPVIRAPGTDSIWQVFCYPTPSCFSYYFMYGGGYVVSCIAENGRGFWIRHQNPTICCIGGEALARDSIPVAASWNLIGTISYPVAVSSIYSIPPNIIRTPFFGFSSRYTMVDTLRPGSAYWVKVNQAGRILLSR